MQPASVGFQCPQCVSQGRSSIRAPRSRFGASLTTGGGTMTKVVIGVLAGLYVLNLISGGLVLGLLAMNNAAVDAGQLWRLVTYGFTSYGLLGMLMNVLVLWLVGRALESELGGWRFLALYVTAGLGGATVFFLLGPYLLSAVGASAAVVGLLATNTIGKYRGREDIRPDLGLFVLLILYSLLVGFRSFGWLGLLGGLAVGALVGVILAYAPRRNRTAIQVVGLLGVVLACLAAVAAKIVLA
jgi:membrane associated rhomboid family serine protease